MLKKIKYLFVIELLLGISVFLNAETTQNTKDKLNTKQTNVTSQSKYWNYFYGVPEFWTTESGALIISCNPPFDDHCYTFITDPLQTTVVINDDDETEFEVTSDPDITTGENGAQIYTFETK